MTYHPISVQGNVYFIRLIDNRYIFSNEKGIDVFYVKLNECYQNFPEQVSVRTHRSNDYSVKLYMNRLNNLLMYHYPEKWVERWIINLFKRLLVFLGEENLMHPMMLDKQGKFNETGYKTYNQLYTAFFNDYPEKMPSNIPYGPDSLELHFMISANSGDTFKKYYRPTKREIFESKLINDDLKLTYAEIYHPNNLFYVETNYFIKSESNEHFLKEIFLVFTGTEAAMCYATDYLPISEEVYEARLMFFNM
jgi:hypothetical protein